MTGVRDRLLERPGVYAAWQAPFAAMKFAPVERELRGRPIGRVLDVGCGTGTNAGRFSDADYVGLDINDRYLEVARSRYRGTFIKADLTTADLASLGAFDTILVNSFLHHVGDLGVERILEQLAGMLSAEGRIHILELVLPPRKSVAWVMAKLDRGEYPRPVERWREMFAAAFDPVIVEPYTFAGGLWSMIYFQGRRRS